MPKSVPWDSNKIRGVAVAEAELFSTGYSGDVLAITRDNESYWSAEVIHSDEHPLHHLVADELDADHPGLELVTCGHGGRVVMLVKSD